jgi:hypothetical protein
MSASTLGGWGNLGSVIAWLVFCDYFELSPGVCLLQIATEYLDNL